jgi:hypothetical protein
MAAFPRQRKLTHVDPDQRRRRAGAGEPPVLPNRCRDRHADRRPAGARPTATIAILLPLTFGIEPVTAIVMLADIFYGAQHGGTITSVLLRLPGEASSVVTVFDGHALAKQGKAGTALGTAAIGSFVSGNRARAVRP